MPVNFDVQAARNSGYSDAEIANAMSQKAGFNIAGARQAGYGDTDIIARLMDPAAPTPQTQSQSPLSPTPVLPPATQTLSRPVDTGKPDATQQAKLDLAKDQGTGESMLIGAGRTFDRVGKGIHQMYNAVTGDTAAQAKLKEQAQNDDDQYQAMQKTHPISTAVGESLPAMAVPVGGAAGTLLATTGKMAAAAAVPAALEYGSPEERAKRAALAAGGAVVGGVVVPKLAGAAVNAGKYALSGLAGNITPEALALAARAKELGIPVNAAQLGDSKFLKTLASSIEQMPFTGGASAVAAQKSAYTSAVGKTFGADTDKITPAVYAFHKERLGQQFDDLAARNNLNVTPDLKSKLSDIVGQAEATGSDDTIRAVKNIMGRVTEQADTKGGNVPAQVSSLVDSGGAPIVKAAATSSPATTTLPGDSYSSIYTELNNIIKGGGEKGLYAKRMQTAIGDAMDQSISPADQAIWAETRSQYKNLKAVRNTVAKGTGNGDIPPTQLMNALNSTEAGKEAMAMGNRGSLGELGEIGQRFVRDSVPNSGTAQRAMAMGLIGGGGYAFGADPTTIAGMMVGGATAGRLLNKVMSSPGTIAALSKQGISMADLAKLPPSKITQILGGVIGMTATNQLSGE